MIRLRIDFSGLQRLKRKLLANPGMMRDIRAAWGTLYRAFVRNRFARLSRSGGGGEWPALAPSTIRRRRRRSSSILRDTGAMFAATQPSLGASGLVQSLDKPVGIEVMLGGTPISTIAGYHDAGGPHLPQRTILVVPPQNEIDKMRKVGVKIMVDEANK